MTLIEQIKEDQLDARKRRITELADILTVILGEGISIGKNASNRLTTDSEMISLLKKFEKNCHTNIELYHKAGLTEKQTSQIYELGVVRKYLPVLLTDYEISCKISDIMSENNLTYEKKSLGVITKILKEELGNKFDGSQVSIVFNQSAQ